MPTVDWVFLGIGESKEGRNLAAFTAACLQTHLAFRQEKHVLTIISIIASCVPHLCQSQGRHKPCPALPWCFDPRREPKEAPSCHA